MNKIICKIAGIITVSLITTHVSIGGHTLFGLFAALDSSEHHAIEHELDIAADTILEEHSQEADCHSTDPQLTSSFSNPHLKVISLYFRYSYTNTETQRYPNVVLSSQREKLPLFEMAKIHTSTLTQRV